MINHINDSSCEFGITREELLCALPFVGIPPVSPQSYDNWPAGHHPKWPVDRYSQKLLGAGVSEPYGGLEYHGTTLNRYGCGLYTTASALSTLTQTIINPAELFIVLGTIDTWTVSEHYVACPNPIGSGAFSHKALAAACTVYGFRADVAEFDRKRLDDCLDLGGVLVGVFHGPPYSTVGHYIMVYDKFPCSGDFCYCVLSTTERERGHNHLFPPDQYEEKHIHGHYPFSLLLQGQPNQCFYIYPREVSV